MYQSFDFLEYAVDESGAEISEVFESEEGQINYVELHSSTPNHFERERSTTVSVVCVEGKAMFVLHQPASISEPISVERVILFDKDPHRLVIPPHVFYSVVPLDKPCKLLYHFSKKRDENALTEYLAWNHLGENVWVDRIT